ncbi:MAG: protein phosphatase 2C domain-containing protein [Bifidobacteriaceae bacterium]|nr:protein phosphatase 2C domain-containing protein [Bifidobacteriaceae bacterium]
MPHVAIDSSALSDIGLKRHDNQDSYLNDSGLYLVADGMGGGVSGRAASATALSCLGRLSNTPIRSRSMIESCIQEAQQQVLGIGETKNSVAGTTLTGLILKDTRIDDALDGSWYVVNIGDSRTYHANRSLDGGWDVASFSQLTHDHSQRQQVIDSGQMLPEAAERLVPRNIITRAIGSPDGVQPDFFKADLPGRFVICSDGVYSMLTQERMAALSTLNLPADDVAHRLIEAALDGGGDDNATVVVVDVTEADEDTELVVHPMDETPGATEQEWEVVRLSETEDIDSMDDSTLENLRMQTAARNQS